MLLEATSLSKSIGPKDLFEDLTFTIDGGEKIALIGRNGQGKTTLLKILIGEDRDFGGQIKTRKNIRITLTKQEHIHDTEQSALTYILKSVPHFLTEEKILNDFENGTFTDISRYTTALERFTENGYFYLKDTIINTLLGFQISEEKIHGPLKNLSGGEKRYVELARMMYSQSHLFLVDEPTNHMDYIGKERFISWMREEKNSVLVITHDRDVLKYVDKIIELKDKKLSVFNGNYEYYLSLNTTRTTNSVKLYLNQLNRLKEAKKRLDWGLAMRAKSKEWKTRYDHWLKDYEKIKAETIKPSFWIDQDSTESLDKKVSASYHKFKEKNIAIGIHNSKERVTDLLSVRNLSLGYSSPLFSNISFTLKNNDRIFIKGRNGAGKSTLVRTILAISRNETPDAMIFNGEIKPGAVLRIGEYEQEIGTQYLHMTLEDAVTEVYKQLATPISESKVKALLGQYLFDPRIDARQKIEDLSGGQKARFQIIKMLASKPNLLILDEPTNHLDLPSIEELENALASFTGGILYISHDTYFINQIGGETIVI